MQVARLLDGWTIAKGRAYALGQAIASGGAPNAKASGSLGGNNELLEGRRVHVEDVWYLRLYALAA